jgi:16S rRNA (guanine527-N7)-methyltransferase
VGVVADEGFPEGLLSSLRQRGDPALDAVLHRSFELGFLGSMAITDQIEHALGFVAIFESELGGPPSSVIDMGTGGGVPGLVLASCWPDSQVVLMDVNERRTSFLQEVLDGWNGSGRAEVLRGRAEVLGRDDEFRERFDAVTSRSFGLPAATAECGSSFLALCGWMVVSEPPDSGSSVRWPGPGLRQVGLDPVTTLRPVVRFGYQVLKKVDPLDPRYPRRVGIPVKRPIF